MAHPALIGFMTIFFSAMDASMVNIDRIGRGLISAEVTRDHWIQITVTADS